MDYVNLNITNQLNHVANELPQFNFELFKCWVMLILSVKHA